MKTALLFSGQGTQYAGMGKELFELSPSYSGALLNCGSDILGFDLKEMLLDGEEASLQRTSVAQPAIFAVSLLALTLAKEHGGVTFDCVAGHSLGEYAALVASGMLSFEDGFRAIKWRSEAMEKAANNVSGGMLAVIGADTALIENICKQITDGGDYIAPANYNSKVQTVIAGTTEAIEKATVMLKENGVRKAVKLAVAAPFHTKFMNEAAEEFRTKICTLTFKEPSCDYYSNVTGDKLTDFSDMTNYLCRHICSPVQFVSELNAMKRDGVERFVELGPGKVLTGLVKKTLDDVTVMNIEDEASFKATATSFGT